MVTKAAINAAQAIVVSILAMFGGALIGLAPPHNEIDKNAASVVLASLFSVAAFLVLRVTVLRSGTQWHWLVGIAVVCLLLSGWIGFQYRAYYLGLTIDYPAEAPEVRYIKGNSYTEDAKEYRARVPSATDSTLLQKFHLPEKVWTQSSIIANTVFLERLYFLFLITFLSGILSVSEPLLDKTQNSNQRPQ